jgi:hypothetical protein
MGVKLGLTLKEDHRLRVFENRVLRRIFGPKRDEVAAEWRKLHSEELHNLNSSPDIIRKIKSRRMRWARHAARMGEERKLFKVLVGKAEGKRPLGRSRCRWEDGIRMDLREIGLGGVDWIRLAQDRDRWRAVVSAVMNLRGSCATELVSHVKPVGATKPSSVFCCSSRWDEAMYLSFDHLRGYWSSHR